MMNYIRDNLAFTKSVCGRKKYVTAVNGAVTSYMRKRWGITKVREDGDLHHAVDALVVACTTDGMIRQVSRYAALREGRYVQTDSGSMLVDPETGEIMKHFPYPWPDFRRELEARFCENPARAVREQHLAFYMDDEIPAPHPLFVSRMPRRKVTGSAHKDTVKSAKALDEGVVIVKRPLSALKLDKNGEIADYFNPGSDRLLYEALKKQLQLFGGDGTKAFAEPFRKPKRDGTPGPVVKKVKLCEPTTLNVPVQNGTAVADNDSMVRIDVFHVEGDGFYLIPIYVADTLKPALPDRAVVAHKPYHEWKQMQDKDFVFSLYPNDLVYIEHRKELVLRNTQKESTLALEYKVKSGLFYYKGAGISTGAISIITHDNTYTIPSLGIKTLLRMEKYTVDALGEYHPVGRETRQGFHRK